MPDRAYGAALALAVATAALFAPLLTHPPVPLDLPFDAADGAPWTNLLLHATAAGLVLVLCLRATGRHAPHGDDEPRGAVDLVAGVGAAALFAWHPLRVESAAWLGTRRDLEATIGVLVALLAYDAWARRGGTWRYALALAAYATSVVAAPLLVTTLPLLFLLLDAWPLARLDVGAPLRDPRLASRLAEKLPFTVLAGAAWLLPPGAGGPSEGAPLGLRIASAFANVAGYVGATLVPIALTPLRPATAPPWWTPGAVVAFAATTAGLLRARTRAPGIVVGWLWFLLALLPIVDRTPADRWSLLPSIGLALALAWGVSVVGRRRRIVVLATLVVVAAACVVATRRQLASWRDEETLLRHALAVTDENGAAEAALARLLVARGAWDDATVHAAEAVRLRPADGDAARVLGEVRLHEGHLDAAAELFARAVAARPDDVRARLDLGRTEHRRGRLDAAIAALQDVVARTPGDPAAHDALARALRRHGDLAGARAHFERALALGGAPAELLGPLAQTLAEAGDLDGAVARYQALLALTPSDAAVHDRLGTVLVRRGDLDAAERAYRTARELRPDLAEAALHLGTVLAARGALDAALTEYDAALRLAPSLPSAQYGRALVLEATGDRTGALTALRAELATQPSWPPALLRLAALLADDGREATTEARALVDRAAAILGADDPDVAATRRLVERRPTADSP